MRVALDRLSPQEKLVVHHQLSQHLSGKKVYPIGLEISPSGVCQATCDFCFYAGGELGGHRNVFLRAEKLYQVLLEAACIGVKAVTWTGGGEPTLHPNFASITVRAAIMGLEQGLFTNALSSPKYIPNRMKWIRVTITDKPYNEQYIRALRGTDNLSIAFNYKGPQDDEYLWDVLDMCGRVGADYVQVRPALAFHGQTVDIAPPKIHHPLLHITDYKFEDAKKPHGYSRCEGYHFVPFIWEDGNVDVCAYMRKHEGYNLGNIYNTSLKDILDLAPEYVPVSPRCQVCCKNHEINKLVSSLRTLKDVNFP